MWLCASGFFHLEYYFRDSFIPLCYWIIFHNLSIDEHFGCFHFLAVVISGAVNIPMQVFVRVTFGYIPRSGIAGSYSNSVFNFLKNCQTVFPSNCTILHSHQQYMRVPISPHPCQHMLFSILVFGFYYSHYHGCEVVSHCGFDLHLSNDQWCWTSCHVLGHLYSWLSISAGSISADSPNCGSKIFRKIPHSLKRQNLNLPRTGNYLHGIHIVLGIIRNLEMIYSIQEDCVGYMQILYHFI